ncbi:MAG: glycerol acyltransferase [Bacteroidetes bacterium]|uniref:Glycerol acyltransferase n=1 Tax=Phaeocystidibacter marisrubri TaxID=1577780 RepID=A0A6L3ZIU0_9FLAO|nr:1-acyl-sn-glycerol-3-phosphate acyltransferase [Phaeocystidibacter marisrubri]KAB2817801.1 glycerol acyltransferase [Phaeocystidibacter marisrubri]TNE31217.1 MAG: glycerol acyltransferase [Bacteroidota bacterium]GGH73465.1 glycerol acyltransferase [Phaeocystidibacter marisrubri]
MSTPAKYIDLKQVVANKSPKLAKWLPGFIVNYLKRVIHEDDLNRAMRDFGHLHGVEFVNACIEHLGATVEVKGLENLPKEGGVILAANHPLGGLDGIAFMQAVGRVRSDMQFLVNDILLSVENFQPLFIPVNKHGSNPRAALKMIDDAYASDSAVMVFPAGLVSRKIDGIVQDLEWTKSFISKAIRYQKDVIPVHIGGRNSNWFYNLSKFRRFIGLKANIEMLYLPDEMYKQQGQTITLTFGKPIPASTFDKTKSQQDWANYVREQMYALNDTK